VDRQEVEVRVEEGWDLVGLQSEQAQGLGMEGRQEPAVGSHSDPRLHRLGDSADKQMVAAKQF